MNIFVFGNGNISFEDFLTHYQMPLVQVLHNHGNASFLVCDFRGVDTLVLEFLKTKTERVELCHIGERPRYLPDAFKTKVGQWQLKGGFDSDKARDQYAMENCTHFLAVDFNSDEKRKSGTLKNMEQCIALGKELLTPLKNPLK